MHLIIFFHINKWSSKHFVYNSILRVRGNLESFCRRIHAKVVQILSGTLIKDCLKVSCFIILKILKEKLNYHTYVKRNPHQWIYQRKKD